MDKICSKCVKDQDSHSFKKISDKNGLCIYYTHPSKAKLYNDTDGIISHIDNALAQVGNKKWMCIIDGEGFDVKQALEVRTGMGIVNLLSTKYNTNLQEIKIINPTWHIKAMLSCLSSFLNENIISKIKILDDRTYSVLEFM